MARPYLGNPKYTIEIIQKYNFVFQKRFGQNFLIDENIIRKIIDASEITNEDLVIEIGPGIGTLTQYIAERAGEVVAIEIDKALIPVLEETLKDWPNVTIINQDILKIDLRKLITDRNKGQPAKIIANLPYYITTPIIMKVLEEQIPVSSMIFMMQKEVAERIEAAPGTKEYGALSLAVNYYSEISHVSEVPPNCFIPRPNVSSRVICMKKYEKPPVRAENEELLFRLIRASFNQRRKTFANSVRNALSYDREKTEEILVQMGLPPNIRGEALTLNQFTQIADKLQKIQNRGV